MTIRVHSGRPALAELSMIHLNCATVARLERNPTVEDEISAHGFARDVPAGFLSYPVSQAADITAFKEPSRGRFASFADAYPDKVRAVSARCTPPYLYDRGCSDIRRRI